MSVAALRDKPRRSNKPPTSDSEWTVLLTGIAAMLLIAVLYVAFDFPPDVSSSE
jgi:hypothetical protein